MSYHHSNKSKSYSALTHLLFLLYLKICYLWYLASPPCHTISSTYPRKYDSPLKDFYSNLYPPPSLLHISARLIIYSYYINPSPKTFGFRIKCKCLQLAFKSFLIWPNAIYSTFSRQHKTNWFKNHRKGRYWETAKEITN